MPLFDESPVDGMTMSWILGGQRAAADEVAGIPIQGVADNLFPEHGDDHDAAVVLVNAGAAKLDQ